MTPDFYIARNGFRETLMVQIGEDADGYPIEREATVDEEHSIWLAEQREIAA